jgi:integrase
MSRRQGHIRQRSAGSYELRYRANGRTITTTFKGRTLKDAERELRRLLALVDDGSHVDPNRITVGRWLDMWLASVRQQVAPRSHDRYSSIVSHHLAPALGDIPMRKLAPVHLREFYSTLAEGGRADGQAGALSPRSRRQIHRVLSGAMVQAVNDGVIARNPADAFRRQLPKVEAKEMRTLDATQSATLLNRVRGDRLYLPIMLALATGMRRNEILALRWRNIDLSKGSLQIAVAFEQRGHSLRLKPPKNGAGRAITLPAFAVAELRRRKREQAEKLLQLGIRQNGDTLVCAEADGSPLTPFTLTHAFRAFMKKQPDLPRVRFHDLRHTHATQLLLAGVHAKVVQERLGHSSIALTLDIYSHAVPSMQQDAADRLDDIFGSSFSRKPPLRR